MFHLFRGSIVQAVVKTTLTCAQRELTHILTSRTTATSVVLTPSSTRHSTTLIKVPIRILLCLFSLSPKTLVFVPYCSSDVYTGTRNASELTQNLYFHGHHIVTALFDDLIRNTWITEAEQVPDHQQILSRQRSRSGCLDGRICRSHRD